MMSSSECDLKIGHDPRTLPDYAALRDEMNKLVHPARPDVNWRYAETLCLSLFEHNGVELQTLAWYVLARSHRAGLPGLNEGLSILETLITRQWGNLWPQPVHARIEILAGLSQRLQQHQRTWVLLHTDLGALYQAEKSLAAISDVLQRLELKHQAGLDILRQQLHRVAVHLENNRRDAGNPGPSPDVLMSIATAPFPQEGAEVSLSSRGKGRSPVTRVTVTPVRARKPWKPFMAGMLTSLLMGSLLWGALHLLTDHPQQDRLMASVAPLPVLLSEETLLTLHHTPPFWLQKNTQWVKQTQQQLAQLAAMPPDWPLARGTALVHQMQVLLPDTVAAGTVSRQWQQQLEASAAQPDSLEGWQQGMAQLQQLTDRLNQLDGQKGKYMTVSELKSQVFTITQAFNQTVPVEEQLRHLSALSAGEADPAALRSQIALHLKQLLARYALSGRETDEKAR